MAPQKTTLAIICFLVLSLAITPHSSAAFTPWRTTSYAIYPNAFVSGPSPFSGGYEGRPYRYYYPYERTTWPSHYYTPSPLPWWYKKEDWDDDDWEDLVDEWERLIEDHLDWAEDYERWERKYRFYTGTLPLPPVLPSTSTIPSHTYPATPTPLPPGRTYYPLPLSKYPLEKRYQDWSWGFERMLVCEFGSCKELNVFFR
ncbi:hypothetical protein D6783_06000 [Candidatus Woesearchaeota archaeon]|nr:MAG: hypothetical protein D6783_06000 [Candidatus Woesearchaeota archaeon]